MSEDSIIVLRQITKSYTKGKVSIPIFEDLDLDIDEGDFVAILKLDIGQKALVAPQQRRLLNRKMKFDGSGHGSF